jgi:hypothetical protein
MKCFLIVFVIILIINSIFCLKPEDFCKKDKIKSCIAHNCGTKFCTFEPKKCDDFILLGIVLKKWVKDPKAITTFIKHIKDCENKDYKNQWSHRFNFG